MLSAPADSLRLKSYKLDEVVVTGTRNETDIRHLPMTISVVGRQQLEQTYQPSILPALTEQVPGLFTTSRGIMGYGVSTGAAGGMSLRGIGAGVNAAGGPTTSLLVLIDGHPQYMGLMGHPIADAYQSMMAERVEVLRGPASVLYGSNAMGGVINIVTRKMQEDGVKTNAQIGYGSYNTLQTEVSNRVRKGRFSSVVTGSYNRTDGHRRDMALEQMGGVLKLSYDISSAWNIIGDLNVTHFNADNPGPVNAPRIDNDSHITRGMGAIAIQNRYKKSWGAINAFFNWGRHRINDGYVQGGKPLDYRFNSKARMAGISFYQTGTFFTGNLITAGFDYQRFGGKAWNHFLNTDTDQPLVDKTIDDLAGYIDFRQDIGKTITLDAGVRFDHNSHTGNEWIPQGGLTLHLPRRTELKAVVSKGFRNPTIREMYMFPPQNPNLQPEKVINYEIAFSQKFPQQGVSYGVNVFYLHGNNLIQTMRVSNGMLNVNTGEIDNFGIEAEINWQITDSWKISAQYSWLHMERPILASPEHKVSTTVYYSKERWTASTDLQYVHGLYTSLDSHAREKFLLWNARVNNRIYRILRIFAKGENLLAQRYEINQGFPMPKATCMGGIDIQF